MKAPKVWTWVNASTWDAALQDNIATTPMASAGLEVGRRYQHWRGEVGPHSPGSFGVGTFGGRCSQRPGRRPGSGSEVLWSSWTASRKAGLT